MNIFKKIGKSIYGPELYQDLKTAAPSSVVNYYFILALLLSAISGIIIGSMLVVNVKTFLTDESISNLVAVYPAELNLKIANGEFSTNVKEPYFISMPKKWQSIQATSSNKIENLAVIDTSVKKFSPDILIENKTAMFVTKNSIISTKNGSLQITSISDQKSFKYELTRSSIQGMANKFMPIIKPLVYIIPVLVFIGMFILYTLGLVPLFLLALLVWLVLALKKQNKGYMQAYRVTLHAVTVVYILQVIIGLVSGNINWFWTALITILVVIVNVKKSCVPEIPAVSPSVAVVGNQASPEVK